MLLTALRGPTRARPLVLVAGGLLAVLALPGAHAATIYRGAGGDPPSLDPALGSASIAAPILSDLVEGLVVRGARGEPVPGCAESWTVSEDGLVYRFRLRAGLEWSDGRPLAAEDFVYSFRRLVDPATAAPAAGLFLVLDGARAIVAREASPDTLGVSAPDARTVEVRLAAPAPYFIQLLANTQAVPVPRHVIERFGREWSRPGNMVTNGPYVLAERIPQTAIRLLRNPRFHAASTVRIDEVVWRPIQDLGAAFRQFRAGEIDTLLSMPPEELDWVRANMPEALHAAPIQATYYLLFNAGRPPFDDARVRRALSLAIDREAITDRLLKTGVMPAWSLVTPGTGGYAGLKLPAAVMSPAERQAQARELLRAAGYGPDRPLVVPVLYGTHEESRRIMLAVSGMWQDIGARAELTNVEFSAVIRALRTRDFSVARSSLFALFDDPYAFLQQLRTGTPSNFSGYANPAYDARLDAANATADAAARLSLLAEAETLMLADQPVIPIYWYYGTALVGPRVQGWIDAPLGTPPTRYLDLELAARD